MVWQSLRASVWALLTSPVKLSIAIYKLFGFLVKATLYFLVFSIASCLFIYAFAATDSNGVEVPDLVPATYVARVFKDTPVNCSVPSTSGYAVSSTLNSSACATAIKSAIVGYQVKYSNGVAVGNVPIVFSSLSSGSFDFTPGVNATGSAIYCGLSCQTQSFNYSGAAAQYSEGYRCPPSGYPEHIITEGTQCRIKQCPKQEAKSFDGVNMENGAGYACNSGCEVNVLKPTTTKGQFGWQFIGVTTGSVCKCVDSSGNPTGSLNCWFRGYSPDGSGSGTDKTCSAYDAGEVKGVNCGENGSMQVDLGPINDSLVAQGQSITDLQTNDAKQNDYIVKNTNDIAGLRVDVDALKKQGCSVTPTANGVSISCNGTTATAMNGKDGAQGEKGADGVNGARGQDGAPGEKGETGATGATGVQGEKGEAGADGKDGEDGAAGAAGAQGAQGIQGIQGVSGVAGAAGRDGIDGKDGEDGEDGEGLTASQDGDDVGIFSASTGARLATLKGIDKDGIVSELQKSNTTLTDIDDKLEDLSKTDAPTEVNADYGDKFAIKDPARTFSSVLSDHVAQMKGTQMFQAMSGFFSVSFNGDCSPINFNFTVYSQAFDISIDPFCNLTIWPYIRAVVMCVFGFFAFRVGFDN